MTCIFTILTAFEQEAQCPKQQRARETERATSLTSAFVCLSVPVLRLFCFVKRRNVTNRVSSFLCKDDVTTRDSVNQQRKTFASKETLLWRKLRAKKAVSCERAKH